MLHNPKVEGQIPSSLQRKAEFKNPVFLFMYNRLDSFKDIFEFCAICLFLSKYFSLCCGGLSKTYEIVFK